PDAFFEKYRHELAAGRLDEATFRATYTLSIRVVPSRFLAWHGRGERHELPSRSPDRQPRRTAGIAVRIAASLERVSARLRLAAVSPVAAG
ncbi:MAG TPA: hypothetical protein VFY23_14725, partial [Candidatus Limnocylindrales bacterium]|nr:hypothetical protein [Candidatus Limnocylindrales bacterium]